MANLDIYILSAVCFVIVCVIYYIFRLKKGKETERKYKFIYENLELAKSQFETFSIKQQVGGAKAGLAALLDGFDKNGLAMRVGDYVGDDWKGKDVDVFFRALKDGNTLNFVFSSKILQLKSDYEASNLLLAMPEHLRVEKKRHFLRVQPQKNDIHLINVWPLVPGKPLPANVEDMGEPLTHYAPGIKETNVELENISGAGFALRIADVIIDKYPQQLAKGAQLLCLVDYSLDDKNNIAFWCTGEIMNERIIENKKSAIIGLEFTNWAVLAQGQDVIQWAHNSPTRGAKPILQWVEQIDKKSRKNK